MSFAPCDERNPIRIEKLRVYREATTKESLPFKMVLMSLTPNSQPGEGDVTAVKKHSWVDLTVSESPSKMLPGSVFPWSVH